MSLKVVVLLLLLVIYSKLYSRQVNYIEGTFNTCKHYKDYSTYLKACTE